MTADSFIKISINSFLNRWGTAETHVSERSMWFVTRGFNLKWLTINDKAAVELILQKVQLLLGLFGCPDYNSGDCKGTIQDTERKKQRGGHSLVLTPWRPQWDGQVKKQPSKGYSLCGDCGGRDKSTSQDMGRKGPRALTSWRPEGGTSQNVERKQPSKRHLWTKDLDGRGKDNKSGCKKKVPVLLMSSPRKFRLMHNLILSCRAISPHLSRSNFGVKRQNADARLGLQTGRNSRGCQER